jgi:hypothetical protein
VVIARFLPLHPDPEISLYDDTPELDLGTDGSPFRIAFTDCEAGELLCCDTVGRGILAKRLSSELVSVEDGRVDVEPC